jgi:DNA-binding transcriptional ArsR family regulator
LGLDLLAMKARVSAKCVYCPFPIIRYRSLIIKDYDTQTWIHFSCSKIQAERRAEEHAEAVAYQASIAVEVDLRMPPAPADTDDHDGPRVLDLYGRRLPVGPKDG